MPESTEDTLYSALERFKNGNASEDDLHLITTAFASGQIEVIPTGDSEQRIQSGGANFGESNEIRVSGSVIGTQIISGITADQVKVIIDATRESINETTEVSPKYDGISKVIIFGGIISLIAIVLFIGSNMLQRDSSSPSVGFGPFHPTMSQTITISKPTQTYTPTSSETPTPSITPMPLFQSGLITYIREEPNNKKSLHVVHPDHTDITLISNVNDARVLAVSPDQQFMAIVFSEKSDIERDSQFTRFFEGRDLNLVVVSTDGKKKNLVIDDVHRLNAIYTQKGQLLVSVLYLDTITYILAQIDGTNPHDLYQSKSDLSSILEPTAAPEEIEDPSPP